MKKLLLLLTFISLTVQAQQQKKYTFSEQEVAQLQQFLSALPFKDVAPAILFLEQKKLQPDTAIVAVDTAAKKSKKK